LSRPGSDGFEVYNLINSAKDDVKQEYTDQKAFKVIWNGHTSQVGSGKKPDDKALTTSSFTSQVAKDVFELTTGKFDAQQFHFHAGSENTINGVRQDLEMHTVHYPDAA